MENKRALTQIVHRLFFGLFLVASVLVWVRLMRPGLWLDNAPCPEALLIVLATATTLAELARHVPGQNVVAATLLITVGALAAPFLGAFPGISPGPFSYTRRAGTQLFNSQHWTMPLLWVVVLLNARGVARLALRSWRSTFNYGYWLLGLSVALVLLVDFGLESFATRANQHWVWKQGLMGPNWYGTPWGNFLGLTVCALAILAVATPFLINKAPSSESPSLHPLVVWLVLNVIILTSILTRHLWLAAALIIAHCLAIAVFAGIGYRHDTCRV